MDSRLLEILVCPVSKAPLRPLTRAERELVNRAIATGAVTTVRGSIVGTPLADGLVTRDGKVVYRLDDGIPVLLPDEGIGTMQIVDFPH